MSTITERVRAMLIMSDDDEEPAPGTKYRVRVRGKQTITFKLCDTEAEARELAQRLCDDGRNAWVEVDEMKAVLR